MALIKIRVGDAISIVDEKNKLDFDYPFYGININKEFMPSVANTSKVDRRKYKIIRKNRFVFSGMQTGRDNCIRIGIFNGESPVLVSPAYTTFEVTSDKIIPLYFFMIFNSKEKDRYGAFLSDSSVRANLDWNRFCDVELEVPPIEIQKKYVAIYEGMLANLRSYEKGLDDLKLVCEGYIEELRRNTPLKRLGEMINSVSRKNEVNEKNVMGVCSDGVFVSTKANITNVNLSNYSLVKEGEFAYNPSRINLGSLALCEKQCIVSPMYEVFEIKDTNKLNPEYLLLWLQRSEFKRSTLFYAIGSVRDTFDFKLLSNVKIPVPAIDTQNKIVCIFQSLNKRKQYVDRLQNIISRVCPILIRGSISESLR